MEPDGQLRKARGIIVSTGLRNMLRRENRRWWSLRSLLWLLILWTLLVNGLITVLGFSIPHLTESAAAENAEDGKIMDLAMIQNILMGIFFFLGGQAIALGAIIRGHDSVLKERESGTAAWTISKPVSRSSFVMAKMIANCLGLLLTVVLVQGLITYLLILLALGHPSNLSNFAAGLALLGLYITFFMVMAVSLSTLLMSRGITLGLPMLVSIGGFILALLCRYAGIMPRPVILLNVLSPANLSIIAWNTAGGMPLSGIDTITVIATLVWIAMFVVAAMVKFEGVEL